MKVLLEACVPSIIASPVGILPRPLTERRARLWPSGALTPSSQPHLSSAGEQRSMQLRKHVVQETIILGLEGSFTFDCRVAYCAAIAEAIGEGPRRILLNVHRLERVDSASLAMLLATYEQLYRARIQFGIVRPAGPVADMIRLGHLHRTMVVCGTEQEAIRIFEERYRRLFGPLTSGEAAGWSHSTESVG